MQLPVEFNTRFPHDLFPLYFLTKSRKNLEPLSKQSLNIPQLYQTAFNFCGYRSSGAYIHLGEKSSGSSRWHPLQPNGGV
jgi:hypothetical protein